MNENILSGRLTDFDPDTLPEGVHIHEHCHERTTILIRIGEDAWVGCACFDDTAHANGGKMSGHDVPPGKLQCRIAMRRALNAILERYEEVIREELKIENVDDLSWDSHCDLYGEVMREDPEGSTAMRFVLPMRDGSFTRFSAKAKDADEACFELARKVADFARTPQRYRALGAPRDPDAPAPF